MGFLKKIRNNILNQRNSFHVGIGNRSPFSYKGKYAGYWAPEVPDIVIPKPTSQIPVLDAEIALVGKVADAATKVAKAAIEHKVDDPHSKSKRLKKRADRIRERSFRASSKNTKRGDIKSDRLDDKEYDIWLKSIKAKEEEDKIIKAAQKAAYKKNNPNASYAEFDCVINQSGSWDSTTNTCN